MKPILFIGDVHGCYEELDRLLDLAWQPGRQVVFVGDLIHKGPNSLRVLERAKELRAKTILGNHELAFIRYVKKKRSDRPSFEALKAEFGSSLKPWVKEMSQWPLFISKKQWLVVHAGLQPGRSPAKTDARILTNIRTWDGKGEILESPRNKPWYEYYKGDQLIVFGHWARKGLVLQSKIIGLDSGCVYGGHLSGFLWPERRLVQVKAARVYHNPLARS